MKNKKNENEMGERMKEGRKKKENGKDSKW